MKKHWKLMMAVVVLSLAVLAPAGTAMAGTDVILSGQASGTIKATLNQAADGTITGVSGKTIIPTTQTHGSYLAQNGDLYVNTFAPSVLGGGKYGLEVWKKNLAGVYMFADFKPYNVGGVELPVAMFCSLDQVNQANPDTLSIGDIATGLQAYYKMSTGEWSVLMAGTGTNCDESFNESAGSNQGWATGHHNSVYHYTNVTWTNGVPTAQTLDLNGSRLGVAKLGHQSRAFTLDGVEYIVWSDGSAGDLVFVKTSNNESDVAGVDGNGAGATQYRFHVLDGENHSIGLNVDAATNSANGSILGVVPNFATGGVRGVKISHDANGGLQVDVPGGKALTDEVALGTSGDCGLDIVGVNGVWKRN